MVDIRIMDSDLGIGAGAGARWYRVVAIPDVSYGGSAERDYASVLPALLDAAQNRRTFATGWLSRGAGAPLEMVTNAGPLPSIGAIQGLPAGAASRGRGPSETVASEPAEQSERSGGRQRDGEHPYGPPGRVPHEGGLSSPAPPERSELLFPGERGGALRGHPDARPRRDGVGAVPGAAGTAVCRSGWPERVMDGRRVRQSGSGVLGAPGSRRRRAGRTHVVRAR